MLLLLSLHMLLLLLLLLLTQIRCSPPRIQEALKEITLASSSSPSSLDNDALITRCLSMMLLHIDPRHIWNAALSLYTPLTITITTTITITITITFPAPSLSATTST